MSDHSHESGVGLKSGAQLAQLALDKQGYVVVWNYRGGYRIGEVVNSVRSVLGYSDVPGPMLVIGHATLQEFLAQMRVLGLKIPSRREAEAEGAAFGKEFYKLVAE